MTLITQGFGYSGGCIISMGLGYYLENIVNIELRRSKILSRGGAAASATAPASWQVSAALLESPSKNKLKNLRKKLIKEFNSNKQINIKVNDVFVNYKPEHKTIIIDVDIKKL